MKAIQMFVHCRKCLAELPSGQSPQDYRRYSVGFTKKGLQVWCDRHDCNIVHIDFEGARHPADTSAKITR
jgi:hypothetical protein